MMMCSMCCECAYFCVEESVIFMRVIKLIHSSIHGKLCVMLLGFAERLYSESVVVYSALDSF